MTNKSILEQVPLRRKLMLVAGIGLACALSVLTLTRGLPSVQREPIFPSAILVIASILVLESRYAKPSVALDVASHIAFLTSTVSIVLPIFAVGQGLILAAVNVAMAIVLLVLFVLNYRRLRPEQKPKPA